MSRPVALLLSVLLFLCLSSVYADEFSEGMKFAGGWLSAGYGVPLSGTDAFYFSGAGCTPTNKIIILRYTGKRAHESSVTPDETVREIGLLGGQMARPTKSILVYGALGVGRAEVTSRGRFLGWRRDANGTPIELVFDKRTAVSFAVPFEAQALYEPWKYAAVGVSFYGDWNTERSFAAAALVLHLGYFPF